MKRIEAAARTATVVGRHQGKVRVGVVGAGVFGGYHAQKFAASEHAEFIGVFDLNAEAAGKVVTKVGQGVVFGSFEALAEACDALVIATPASSHASLTRKALEAGKHALVEKPLALTGAEARSLAKLALERDLVLSVGHQERLVFEAMGLFSTGERPKRIEGVRMGPASPEGRCEDVSVVFDLMIHDLDLTAELFGGEVRLHRAHQHVADLAKHVVDEVLGVLEAHAEQVLDDLDDLDLLGAGALEDDIELVLLLGSSGVAATTGRGRRSNSDRRSSGDLELLLEGVEQFLEFDDGHVADRVENFFLG